MQYQRVFGRGWRRVAGWFKSSIAQWRTCRECGERVGPLDRVCSVCGASSPVQISAVQTTVIVASVAEAFLLLLHVG